MSRRFQVRDLPPICEKMNAINTGQHTRPDDRPISGADAYRRS